MKIIDKFKLSSNRRKIVVNVYWAVIGKVVNIANALLVGVMVARYLGPSNFGLMSYVISYVTMFTFVASFGTDDIVVRELSKSNAVKETILGTALAIRLVFAAFAILLILVTLVLFESDRFTIAMVMVYSLSLMFSSLNVIRSYFTSIILNEYVVKTEISRTVLGAGIKVLLLLNHCSLAWFIAASTFDFALVASGYLYSYRRKGGSIRVWRFDIAVARMLIKAAFPLFLAGTAVFIYRKLDVIMIRNMIDNASVGQFSAADKIITLAAFVPAVVSQTVAPLLVKAHQDDPARYLLRRQQYMDVVVWSVITVALVMSVMASPAIRLLYGQEYLSAIPVLQIMAWKAVFVVLSGCAGQLLIIENLQRHVVIRDITGCIASVTFNFLLIPVWGVVGSAVASVLTVFVSGYIAHLCIKPFRHLFRIQTKAILFGWKTMLNPFVLRK